MKLRYYKVLPFKYLDESNTGGFRTANLLVFLNFLVSLSLSSSDDKFEVSSAIFNFFLAFCKLSI